MADASSGDPNSRARRLTAYTCFALCGLQVLATIVIATYRVDTYVFVPLLLAGAGLLGIDLKLWGQK